MIKHLQQTEAPDNWFPLNFVRASEPDSFALGQAEEMAPYLALSRQKERYDALVAGGFLKSSGDDTYRLTEKGRPIVEGFFAMAHEELANVEVLPADEMNQLAAMLERIVTNTIESAEPAHKPALMASRWTDPGPDAAAAARIDQYVTDLLRYRDDAHISAWRPTGVDGKTWETLTLFWQGEVSSAAEVSDRLSGRGYDIDDYSKAMNVLEERGWIADSNDGFQITDEGKRVRQDAEEETDRLCYLGWLVLNQSELESLGDLIARLNDKLQTGTLSQCWAQAGLVAQAIFPVTRDGINEVFSKYFANPQAFFPTLMAYGAQPEPMTVTDYSTRYPYTKSERALEILEQAAAGGHLSQDGDSFTITSQGKESIVQVNDVFYKTLGEIDPLPEQESAELAGLLATLVEASQATAEPKVKWALANMHGCHPEKTYGSLVQIDQSIDDLNAFRDDTHIASWQSYGVSGRDWDALTLLWRGQAQTAAGLAEELQAKGYSADEYGQSLDELAGRGWLEMTKEGVQLSDQGRQIRQEAEQTTDRYFFAPWQELGDGRLLRLHTLLVQMKLGLLALADEQGDAQGGDS
jgi:predicted transcriptional regulator